VSACAACFFLNDYRLAEDSLRKATRALDDGLVHERFGLAGYPAAMARWLLASSLSERGEFAEGLVQGQEGLRIAEEVDHPYSLILACLGLAFVYGLKGESGKAGEPLNRGLALCREWNVPVLSPITAGFLGYVSVLSGRVEEGISSQQEGLKAQESTGLLGVFHSLLVVRLGESFVLVDRIDEAFAQAERALALTRERGERGTEAWALHLLGQVAARRALPDARPGEGYYREALERAGELEMRPLAAHCHLGLSRLYRRAGNRAQAAEHLATAATMYREMDMRFWSGKAEAEMTELA